MSYVDYDVIVNKITKAKYDEYVESGEITQAMIEQQAWLFTDDQFLSAENLAKLVGIESNAQVNIIEEIHVNGLVQDVNSKVVNIVIPTKLSEFENDLNLSGYENKIESVTVNGMEVSVVEKVADIQIHEFTNQDILDATSASFTTGLKSKLDSVANDAQVNVIEEIHVNGEALSVSGKTVNIEIPRCVTRVWS